VTLDDETTLGITVELCELGKPVWRCCIACHQHHLGGMHRTLDGDRCPVVDEESARIIERFNDAMQADRDRRRDEEIRRGQHADAKRRARNKRKQSRKRRMRR
jgi:hypothetical protein